MFLKKIIFIFIFILSYQSTQFSKSASFDSKNVSKYFSGIVAFDNKNNSEALNFFNSFKIISDGLIKLDKATIFPLGCFFLQFIFFVFPDSIK